jgi:hypothetical protein
MAIAGVLEERVHRRLARMDSFLMGRYDYRSPPSNEPRRGRATPAHTWMWYFGGRVALPLVILHVDLTGRTWYALVVLGFLDRVQQVQVDLSSGREWAG